MDKIPDIHPGQVLKEEFLVPFHLSSYRLSKETGIPELRISQIIRGKRSITANTALKLSRYFGNSAQFWLGLQMGYDIEKERMQIEPELEKIHPLPSFSE